MEELMLFDGFYGIREVCRRRERQRMGCGDASRLEEINYHLYTFTYSTHFVRGSFAIEKDLTAPGRHSDVERERADRFLPKTVRINSICLPWQRGKDRRLVG
jgi:hypothetical protein